MEKHFDFTPYNYVLRNPLRLVDPEGKQEEFTILYASPGNMRELSTMKDFGGGVGIGLLAGLALAIEAGIEVGKVNSRDI
ncbi:MAG: hypothetical protein L0Y79_10915 [Chlorobi bacterium]|nr:hypothetical protein [Chlorobiota bacterium]MCI0715568.1 hypothetical protein [Chlorobiota bacterium]